jgi:hypothetical protein
MDTIKIKLQVVWALAAPYCLALYGMMMQCLGWAWAALLISLKPFWVPAVTLARNPLTAVVVGVLVIGAYFAGDRVRAVRDYVTVSKMVRAHHAELRKHDQDGAALLLSEKAKDAEELNALKKQVDALEAKLRTANIKPDVAPAKPTSKAKAVVPAQKPANWSWF